MSKEPDAVQEVVNAFFCWQELGINVTIFSLLWSQALIFLEDAVSCRRRLGEAIYSRMLDVL